MKLVFELLATCLAYALVIASIDFAVILIFQLASGNVIYYLSLVLLTEGGVVLTVGGASAFFSPVASKIEEVLFHSKPWNATRQKEAERRARPWIVTGIFLVVLGLLISAF